MTTTVFVPIDATARSLGADAVAAAIVREAAARGEAVQVVRNGTRGMCWLEPLVEVATPAGRIAYGPVAAEDVAGLFAAGARVFVGPPLSASGPRSGSANVVPACPPHGGSGLSQTRCFSGHCTSPSPIPPEWHVIGAPQS